MKPLARVSGVDTAWIAPLRFRPSCQASCVFSGMRCRVVNLAQHPSPQPPTSLPPKLRVGRCRRCMDVSHQVEGVAALTREVSRAAGRVRGCARRNGASLVVHFDHWDCKRVGSFQRHSRSSIKIAAGPMAGPARPLSRGKCNDPAGPVNKQLRNDAMRVLLRRRVWALAS